MTGGEVAALVGVPGLEDDRGDLRGLGDGEGAVDVEEVAVPVEGTVTPAVGLPQGAGEGDEVGGTPVAVGAVEVTAAPEVRPGEGVVAGDHVPRGTAAGDAVERGEGAGEVVGLVEGRVEGAGQSDVCGDGGEGGEDRGGLGASDDVLVEDLSLVFAQAQALGEEEEVEEAAFGGAGEVLEVCELDVGAGVGVGPHGGVVDAREVGGEVGRAQGGFRAEAEDRGEGGRRRHCNRPSCLHGAQR